MYSAYAVVAAEPMEQRHMITLASKLVKAKAGAIGARAVALTSRGVG